MEQQDKNQENASLRTLIVGGGCFWCQDANSARRDALKMSKTPVLR